MKFKERKTSIFFFFIFFFCKNTEAILRFCLSGRGRDEDGNVNLLKKGRLAVCSASHLLYVTSTTDQQLTRCAADSLFLSARPQDA
jgi:hypothetical protein